MPEPAAPPDAPPASSSRWRLLALAALIVATFAIGHATGATESLSKEGIRRWVEAAGPWGWAAFVALFAVGELLHVPGLVFVGAGVWLWGPVGGGAVSAAGALVSLVTSFAVVRAVGGTHRPRWRLVERLLTHLERRPVLTVALLRAVLILSPPVTYALALSPVRFRDYLLGSAIGLVPPLTIFVALFSRLPGAAGS